MQRPLDRLLDRHAHLPPEYRGGLTNHLPMALHALQDLGADEARMEDFAAVYLRRFTKIEPLPPAAPAADWRALRGAHDAYVALHGAFAAMLEEQGVDATLKRCLPDLWSGVSAAAFHGVIRTGHAVQSGHRESLNQALAYWAWRWQPMSASAVAGPLLSLQEWTRALADQARDLSQANGLISGRMQMVQDTAPYIDLSGSLQSSDLQTTLHALWSFAAERYAQTGNFTVLHMVTACRAAQVLSPWLTDSPALRSDLARAYAAALLVTGAVPAKAADVAIAAASWSDVIVAAIASDDDHVIKLVHACRDANRLHGDGPWLAAAARAVRQQ